jgi:hypothetical protein
MELGPHTGLVAQRRVFYSPTLKDRWHQMWAEWIASDRTVPAVWQEFERLIGTPGFHFGNWKGGRFAESVVALDLLKRGSRRPRPISPKRG